MDHQFFLKKMQPEHEYFVGIDSDGCVFDTMEAKQKQFFLPNALKYFNLFPIENIVRQIWEFVNLYSVHRGGNRFISVIKVFEILNESEQVKNSGVKLPEINALKQWVKTENKLSNENLRKYFQSNHDPDLGKILRWSEVLNEEISRNLRNITPFPYATEAIKKISSYADIVIISQTPVEALEREWGANNLKKYARLIAGQEHGTKTEHLAHAAIGKYQTHKILMIGDAPGDLDAAKNNGILFFPVVPGKEDESWKRFLYEGFEKFLDGSLAGKYENSLLKEFKSSLPSIFYPE